MDYVTLGKTGITVNKNGYGALPIQRTDEVTAIQILQKAYAHGINYYDTARAYTDSEAKLGKAFHEVRGNIYLATKTMAKTVEDFWNDLHESLKQLQTEYIDLYQFHNPPFCPKPNDGTGLYEAMREAKEQGLIRHIGITEHRLDVAREAIESDLYETLQFPFCYLSTAKDKELVELCLAHQMGFIAMKSLSGGLINNSAAAYAFASQYAILPIWGIQREKELDEFLSYQDNPPILNESYLAIIKHDQEELSGNFCRACGYCMPCPAGIEIPSCARMSLLLRRSPTASHLNERGQKMMKQIEQCLHCNQCKSKCPYGLDTPQLLQENYRDYLEVLHGKAL